MAVRARLTNGDDVDVNRRRRWLSVTFLLIGAVVVVILLLVYDILDLGDQISSVVAALTGLFALGVGILTRSARNRADVTDPADRLTQAADKLTLLAQQQDQPTDPRLPTRPGSLAVGFASTVRPVAATAAEVVGTAMPGARPTMLKLNGDTTTLANTLDRLPARQLVVLGEPGAGKTTAAVQLVAALAARRAPGGPAPVLMSLSSWNPAAAELRDWLATRIAVEYPPFRPGGDYGPEVAVELVRGGLVLPVLDGFDEIAPTTRTQALRGISAVAGRDRPLVLTSRPEEYQEAVGETGFPLGRAAVVELAAVSAETAADFLESGLLSEDERWAPITAELRRDPDGMLAQSLSTPLMVDLAKTAYAPADTDPARLLVPTTRQEVEHMLLDAYIPALYPLEESPEKVTATLAFLARRLTLRPGADLSWWRLFLLLPYPQVVVSAVKAGLAVACMFVPTVVSGFPERTLEAIPMEGDDVTRVFVAALINVLVLVAFFVPGAVIGALIGLGMRIVVGRFDDDRLVPLPKFLFWRPKRVLIAFGAAAVAGPVFGLMAFSSGSHRFSMIAGVLVAVTGVVNIGLVERIQVDVEISPQASLAADRNTALVLAPSTLVLTTTLFTLSVLSSPDYVTGAVEPVEFGLSLGVVYVFLFPLTCAWTKYSITRLLLRVTRKTPWQLLDFLELAHQRGVLRRVGGVYQFRHLRLQRYFAAK